MVIQNVAEVLSRLSALALAAGLAERRGAAIALWAATLALYAVTLVSHMTDRLAISL